MKRMDHGRIGRRGVVCGGGAAAIGAVLDSYFAALKPVRAQEAAGTVPEIDRLAVRVLVDSYQIAVAPSFKRDNVDVERFGWALGDQPPSKALISEFGLSLHAESRRGDETRNVLIDCGFTAEALNSNLDLLGVDPTLLDALVLSHGHYDHFGGMAGFLRAAQGKLKPGFIIGGEECFCARHWTAPPLAGNFGVLDRAALQAANLTVTSAEAPSLVADHALTTGQVPLATFEKVLSPSKMTIGVSGGFGCYPEKLPEDERQGGTIPDQCHGRVPSRPVQGGLCTADDRGPERDRSRLKSRCIAPANPSGTWPALKCRTNSCALTPARASCSLLSGVASCDGA